jgi:1-acyl-sn-glycerol-3-phosphate acyltransferase
MRILKGCLGFIWKCWVGIVFCLFAILLYPFFFIVLSNPKWKKKSFKLFVFWSWLMRIFCFYPVRFKKKAPLPEAPYIIVANHSSYLDIFLMYSILPGAPFLFLGKGEILKYPIIKTYFKGLNIPVHRKDRAKAARSFIMSKEAVANDWSLVIFPEGGIPDENNPKMIPFKKGAFRLAKEVKVPIVPVTFTNNYQLFSDPTQLLGPARPGLSKVYIHEFISPQTYADMTESELSDYCFNIINEALIKEYPKMKDEG